MDHYEILGVPTTATAGEIKRAYRRLAVLYHPDKNPDPAAENFFKEVNHAYDVLGDPVKKRAYDQRWQNVFETPAPPRHRDPAYRTNRPKPKYKGDRQRLLELMADYLPFVQKGTLVCLVISSFLMLDFFLPHRVNPDVIDNGQLIQTRGRYGPIGWWKFHTTAGRTIVVESIYSKNLAVGSSITVEASLILGITKYLNGSDGTIIRLAKSIYGNFFFAPVGLFLFSLLGYLFRNKIETSFNLGIASMLLLGLTGVIVLIL